MAEIVANCPRCGVKHITFDVAASNIFRIDYGWQNWYEIFCRCRHCKRTSIFIVAESVHADYQHVHAVGLLKLETSLNNYVEIKGHISLKDQSIVPPPDHVPPNIAAIFIEGSTCLAVGCYNAAATMFRLCVDLSTRHMLPLEEAEGLNTKTRRDLGLRLPWLFKNKVLPEILQDLSSCIKEDGNDGAHAGTIGEPEAEDLLDFTAALLERIYTEPERLRIANERRKARRSQ